jgi:hypothetical protein
MQQHALVRLGDAEHLADFLRLAALHVAQGNHRPLRGGQRFDRTLRREHRLALRDLFVRPRHRRR